MAQANDLTCQELVEIVTDYLDGGLPPSDRARFEDHLRQCEMCSAYLTQMQATIAVVGTLSEDGVDPMARDHLLQIFRDWNRAERAV